VQRVALFDIQEKTDLSMLYYLIYL